MSRCPRCGSPPPPPERILPLGIDMERLYAHIKGPAPSLIGEIPASIPWRCRGTREEIDAGFLRFGIIARTPYLCRAPRSTNWNDATLDLRHRAIEARALRLSWDGMI